MCVPKEVPHGDLHCKYLRHRCSEAYKLRQLKEGLPGIEAVREGPCPISLPRAPQRQPTPVTNDVKSHSHQKIWRLYQNPLMLLLQRQQ